MKKRKSLYLLLACVSIPIYTTRLGEKLLDIDDGI